jgi:hypothetical protein
MLMRMPVIASLAACAALVAAGSAHAGGNVQWSVGVNLPNVATVISNFPVPVLPQVVVHAPPQVVYREPRPVVVQPVPRVVYQPHVVVVGRPVPVSYGPYWRHGRYRNWDRDGDGIPNRHDRFDNRRHGAYGDRDGDGIPNRYDRRDDRNVAQAPRGGRDRDGAPGRRDRGDDRKWRH